MDRVKIYEKQVVFPTYEAGKPEKNPLFIEKRAYQGSTGKVYPLPVTEKISEEKKDKEYKALILENEYLYVMVLPELGGRIQRAYDKTNGYDFIYFNRVIKPALVGLAGPWVSGGIEFNWPQHHRPSTFMPVDYAVRENADGSGTVIIGETDRMYGTKGNAEITLYPGKAYIEIKGRLYNPTDYPQTFLWWANPAVAVNDDTFSVFPPDVNAVMDHGKRAVSTFPIATGEYYKADYSDGVDISRYRNIRVPTSYMAAHSDFDFVGNFDEGRDAGLLHVADHHISPGKKQWTWGCGDFGKMWDKNLTDEDGPYIELMTGMFCDNQPDFTWLKPQEEKNFVQYFMPYKSVGRVSNATKDCVIGVDFVDGDGHVIEPDPFGYGKEALRSLEKKADSGRIKIYATSVFEGAVIKVTSEGRTVYEKTVTLSPEKAFIDHIRGLSDYTVTVLDKDGKLIASYDEYVKENRPIPEPQEAMEKPEKIESLEELYLAGQHLEQYRHATFLPSDYYMEGLKRDPSDIRLNNAMGLLLLRNGMAEKSVPYFKAAIEKQTRRNPNPYSGEAYFNLGLAMEALGKYDEAYEAFFKATWSYETQANAFFHLACISVIRDRDCEKALAFADESLIRQYHSMRTRALRAGLLIRLGRDEEYRKFMDESMAIDRMFLPLSFREKEDIFAGTGSERKSALDLARELISYGFFDEAADVLAKCKDTDPLILYYRAYALLRDGRKNEALDCAEAAEKADKDLCFPGNVFDEYVLTEMIGLLIENGIKAPQARYLRGLIRYDRKRYAEAVKDWEDALGEDDTIALADRNLSIALFNHAAELDLTREEAVTRAVKYISEAVRLDPDNSRMLLEQDQLLRKTGACAEERLMKLEGRPDLVRDRYALMLAYVGILNDLKRHEEALTLIMGYTFHVWEGEGKVADQYKEALFGLAEREMEKGTEESLCKTVALIERTLAYPDNLGEGKLDNVPDNRAYYLMGKALKELGDEAGARKCFIKATEGSQVPEPVRYYNDQPSDYIFYQGLAFKELGERKKAMKSFHQLITFGETHIFDEVGYDFFAVSLPELEVYQDDMKGRSDDYCRRMAKLGRKGLSILESEG